MRLKDRFEVLLDDVCCSLWGLQTWSGGDTVHEVQKPPRRDPIPAEAPAWIKSLETRWEANGSLAVKLNGHQFTLQPHLGALLVALAEDTGPGPDEGIAFKTLGDLSTRMHKCRGGRLLTNDTINKYIFRLRVRLAYETRQATTMIHTHGRLGRRLAIRRRRPVPPAR